MGLLGRREIIKGPPPTLGGKGYRLGSNDNGEPWIQCLKCGRKSYHPKDIAMMYCGYDHIFHEYDPTQYPPTEHP